MRWKRLSLYAALAITSPMAGSGLAAPPSPGVRVGDSPTHVDDSSPTDGLLLQPTAHRGQGTYIGDEGAPIDPPPVPGEIVHGGSHVSDGAVPSVADSYVGDVSPAEVPMAPLPNSYVDGNSGSYVGTDMVDATPMPSSACGSGDCGPGAYGSFVNRKTCAPRGWFQGEVLLWWAKERNLPPLLTENNTGFGAVGEPGTDVLFGGPTAIDMQPGFRFDVGRYLGGSDRLGVGLRAYAIDNANSDFSVATDGSRDLWIPFFDSLAGVESAVPVTGGGVNGQNPGTISANDDFEFVGAEAYGRLLWSKHGNRRVDLIGGYTFHLIENDLTVNSLSVDNITGNLIPDGTGTTTTDIFDVNNTFHGGHIGFQATQQKQKWIVQSLFKVHLGNMHQEANIRGSTLVVDNTGALASTTAVGSLTGPNNSGNFERDQFTFTPELNLKLGYRLTSITTFTVGYSFLYWNDLALAGELVDRNVDIIGGPGAPPQFSFADTGYWLQGIDLGLSMNY
jgi:hypothetical protein